MSKSKGATKPTSERGQGTKVVTGSSSTVRIKGLGSNAKNLNRGKK